MGSAVLFFLSCHDEIQIWVKLDVLRYCSLWYSTRSSTHISSPESSFNNGLNALHYFWAFIILLCCVLVLLFLNSHILQSQMNTDTVQHIYRHHLPISSSHKAMIHRFVPKLCLTNQNQWNCHVYNMMNVIAYGEYCTLTVVLPLVLQLDTAVSAKMGWDIVFSTRKRDLIFNKSWDLNNPSKFLVLSHIGTCMQLDTMIFGIYQFVFFQSLSLSQSFIKAREIKRETACILFLPKNHLFSFSSLFDSTAWLRIVPHEEWKIHDIHDNCCPTPVLSFSL